MQKTKLNWKVSEDNGGGLQLWVLEDNNVVYVSSGYEYNVGQLCLDLGVLRSFDSVEDWDGNEVEAELYDIQEQYESILKDKYPVIIAEGQDNYAKLHYGIMGKSGRLEFDILDEHQEAHKFESVTIFYAEEDDIF